VDAPAKITSVDAIESFRASLILYLSKARPVVEEVSSEVMRTRLWVQHDQRMYWENQMRLRKRKLEEAQEELFNARLSQFQESTTLQHLKMQRAQAAVKAVEEKLAMLKKWDREMENRTDPLVKQVEQLSGFLSTDMARAINYLEQVVKTLDAYLGAVAPTGSIEKNVEITTPTVLAPAESIEKST
jgi:hypothetical protein